MLEELVAYEDYILFFIGFFCLIKGADWLVDGAASIAKKFNTSDLVIGLTIVSFGTSLPELIINIIAGLNGSPDLAIGNILGSNVANILLILGVSAMIFPLAVKRNTFFIEIPFSILAAIMVGALIYFNFMKHESGDPYYMTIDQIDGVILLSFFAMFMFYIGKITKKGEDLLEDPDIGNISLVTSLLLILAGILGVGFGGKWVVEGAVHIAAELGVGETMIGLTVVAIGTSLPELATSAIAAYKKNADIAVGNVVGSNIFNIFWILGVSSVLNPITTDPETIVTDVALVTAVSLLFFLILFVKKYSVISRWKGILFVACYVAYTAFLILRETGTI